MIKKETSFSYTKKQYFNNPEVNSLYARYKKRCEDYFGGTLDDDGGERKYYVYAWCTNTNPKKYFYVGKGTGNRWKHVEKEIDTLPKNMNELLSDRHKQYAYLKDRYGIKCEILLEKLTNTEARIYEQCKKYQMAEKGEVLLDGEGNTADLSWIDRTPGPRLLPDPFMARYTPIESPSFDKVSAEGLKKIWFYPYFIEHNAESLEKERRVSNYVISKGGKIQSTNTISNTVVISGQGGNAYYEYKVARGKLLYSIDDILEYIKNDSSFVDDGSDPRIGEKTQLFIKKKEEMTKYIKNLLVEAGADENAIVESKYHDEVHLGILGHDFVSFLPYKKKPGGVITVPLDDADKTIKPLLTRITSWKGDFVFENLSEVEILLPFFRKQVEKCPFGPLFI